MEPFKELECARTWPWAPIGVFLAAECEMAGIRVSASKSEAMVSMVDLGVPLGWGWTGRLLWCQQKCRCYNGLLWSRESWVKRRTFWFNGPTTLQRMTCGQGTDWKSQKKVAAKFSFCRERVGSSEIWRELRAEPLLPCVKSRLLRRFRHLAFWVPPFGGFPLMPTVWRGHIEQGRRTSGKSYLVWISRR